MQTTYHIGSMPHLDRLRLGAKFIPCGNHRNLNFHDHKFSELSIILQVSDTRHLSDGKSHLLRRGDVILMHPGKLHAYENTEGLALFNLLYEPANLPIPWLDGGSMLLFSPIINPAYDPQRPSEKPLTTLDEGLLSEVETAVLQLKQELDEENPGKTLRSFALFLNILTLICRSGRVDKAVTPGVSVSEAVSYLNSNYHQNADIEHLAKRANISRRVFFRKFKELTGYSPLQYLIQRRLAAAEHLLNSTDMALTEIAEKCGFCDSNHLAKLFLRQYRIPPGAFRKKSRKKDK